MNSLISQLFTDGYIYIIFYLWLFFVAILETLTDFKKYKLVFATSTFILLSLFTGLRWETGTDWVAYKELFDTLKLDWTFILNVYSFDFGYVIFNAFVKIFTESYTIFLLIDSFLALGIVFGFLIKFSTSPNISFFVFYNSFFVSQFMGSNRRIIALGAMLFAFYYVYSKSKKRYAFFQVLGFLFHRSSIIGLFTWLVPRNRFSNKKVFTILILTLLMGIPQLPFKMIGAIGNTLSFMNNQIVVKMQYYSEYNEDVISENVNPAIQMTLSVIKRCIFLSFYLYIIYKRKNKLDPVTDYFFNIYILGFAFYMLLNGSPIFQMLSTYFTFIEIALIGRFWSYAEKRLKYIFFGVLFIYGFFQLLSALNGYPDLFMPYKSFLTNL